MSDLSSLSDLAGFVPQSRLTTEDSKANGRALKALSTRLLAKSQRRTVGELLGVVLVLSARTRRMVLPRVQMELDVFGPTGRRAVRIFTGPVS